MSAKELIEAVNHAAGMNDRWLFIASLVVFGIFAAGVMRYFVRQHERLIADHKQARDTAVPRRASRPRPRRGRVPPRGRRGL